MNISPFLVGRSYKYGFNYHIFIEVKKLTDLELNIRKGDIGVTIRGSSKEEVLQKIDDALALLEDAMEKLKTKKIEIATAPIVPPVEIPHLSAPPTSCRDAIVKLLSTDWGKTPKTLAEIIEVMKINGIYFAKARVASDLLALTRTGITRRLKSEAGFAYILAKPV